MTNISSKQLSHQILYLKLCSLVESLLWNQFSSVGHYQAEWRAERASALCAECGLQGFLQAQG